MYLFAIWTYVYIVLELEWHVDRVIFSIIKEFDLIRLIVARWSVAQAGHRDSWVKTCERAWTRHVRFLGCTRSGLGTRVYTSEQTRNGNQRLVVSTISELLHGQCSSTHLPLQPTCDAGLIEFVQILNRKYTLRSSVISLLLLVHRVAQQFCYYSIDDK